MELPFNYRAKVEGHAPDVGTVYIRVPGLHDDIPTNQLPIAYPAYDLFGSDANSFMAMTPAIGSYVYIFFDGGNFLSPVYFAYAPKSLSSTAAAVNNPKIVIDSSTTSRFCIEFAGATICIASDGTVTIDTPGNVLVKGQNVLLN